MVAQRDTIPVPIGARHRELQLPDERLDDDRIELCPRYASQLDDGKIVRQADPVRTLRRHGLVGVAHRDDLRRERDLVTLETIRVAGAIETLVVREHDRADPLQVRDLTQEVRADHRVRAHLGPLLVAERRGLAEDVLRDADLSDVVEERAELHGRHLVGTEAERPRHSDGVLHRRRRAAVGVVVLRGERAEQGRDDRHVRLLEVRGGALQALVRKHQLLVARAQLRRLRHIELERVPGDEQRQDEDERADHAERLVREREGRAIDRGRDVVERHPREVLEPHVDEAAR